MVFFLLLYIISIIISWYIQKQIIKYDDEQPFVFMIVILFVPIANIVISTMVLLTLYQSKNFGENKLKLYGGGKNESKKSLSKEKLPRM